MTVNFPLERNSDGILFCHSCSKINTWNVKQKMNVKIYQWLKAQQRRFRH